MGIPGSLKNLSIFIALLAASAALQACSSSSSGPSGAPGSGGAGDSSDPTAVRSWSVEAIPGLGATSVVSNEELNQAIRVCLVTGDPSRGLISAFQRWRFRKTGAVPVIGKAQLVSFTTREAADGTIIPKVEVWLLGETYHLTQVDEAGAKHLVVDRISTARPQVVQRDFSVEPFVTVAKGKLLVPYRTASPASDDSSIHLLDSDLNAADYADCLRAEIRGASAFSTLGGQPGLATTDCPELADWKRVKSQRFGAEYDERLRAADLIKTEYFEGRFSPGSLHSCLSGEPDRANFLNTLGARFFDEGLTTLRRQSGESAKALADLYDASYAQRELPLKRLESSYRSDFSLEHPEAWRVVFLHELAHLLDARAAQASERIADAKIDLSAANDEEIAAWVSANLERGLFAEHRACLQAWLIYREGLAQETTAWSRLAWLEAIFPAWAEPMSGSHLPELLYRELERHVVEPASPDVAGFELASVREAYARARRSYGEGRRIPTPNLH